MLYWSPNYITSSLLGIVYECAMRINNALSRKQCPRQRMSGSPMVSHSKTAIRNLLYTMLTDLKINMIGQQSDLAKRLLYHMANMTDTTFSRD